MAAPSFGFKLHHGEVWFCNAHRAEGIAMWAREKAEGAGQRQLLTDP